MKLSYCVVNTNAREHLLTCLNAIRRTHPPEIEHEVIVLDNASADGSADAVRSQADVRLVARDRRAGLAENNSLVMREATGEFCLLLNEDAEVQPGAAATLLEALRGDPDAAIAGAQLLDPEGGPIPCAWRFPSLTVALAQALFLHKRLVTQSGHGEEARAVGWVQSAAMLVRREAAVEVGYYDPDFFLYSEEVDFQKRLHDTGWRILHVPAARAIHHEQLATDRAGSARRVVQFHRSRDQYMRKHHSAPVALACRVLWAWSYVPRAVAAIFIGGRSPGYFWLHARRALRPRGGGEGMAEAAEAYNRRLTSQRAVAARAGR